MNPRSPCSNLPEYSTHVVLYISLDQLPLLRARETTELIWQNTLANLIIRATKGSLIHSRRACWAPFLCLFLRHMHSHRHKGSPIRHANYVGVSLGSYRKFLPIMT